MAARALLVKRYTAWDVLVFEDAVYGGRGGAGTACLIRICLVQAGVGP
ncbi:hypothetical protein EDC26_11588, partial [Paralcaligenes ureilyticus]